MRHDEEKYDQPVYPPLSNLKNIKLFSGFYFKFLTLFKNGWKRIARMPLNFFFILVSFLAFLGGAHSQSEILVNKVWDKAFGAPGEYEWATSILDNMGNLIITGHTTVDQNNIKLILVKQSSDGAILWQEDYQLSENTKNGGVALAIDEYNDIIVGGVTSSSGNTADFDFLILKYGSEGEIIWDQAFDGAGNGVDVPIAIVAEDDQVFVCGPSEGDNTGIDFWLLKLDGSDGSQEWEERYDFAGLDDYPADMALDDSGNLVITGTSAVNLLT